MPWTDDPLADFHRHDAQCENALARLPRCCECDKPIQSEFFYEINGEYICPDCMSEHRKYTEDFKM